MKDILKAVMYGAVFAVPFVLLIVSSSMLFPYITGKNFMFRILVEIAFMSWAVLAIYEKTFRPKLSLILISVASMVGVMFVANIFGEYSQKSFWSNFERMEGWVTLVHFFAYFLVLTSVMTTEKLWLRFLNTALVAGIIMSLYALAQILGWLDVSQGTSWRVDGRLGNSTYLGVYMLFHMFIAGWMFVRTKSQSWRYVYGGLFFLFGFILLRTGTRGATLGFAGGSILAFSYLALMAPHGATIKKWALGGLVAVVLVVGGLWALRDTEFVKNSTVLSRFANVSLAEGNIRFTVWKMAIEGVKEHPILGWGQENFNYVFNKYYDPALYGAEPWYDRTHNIFFDWLIAGGIIGLLAYLSILASMLWYSIIKPAWSRFKTGVVSESNFTVIEQALLLGLLAAYTFHNLFVFDNLASWILFAVVLALVHGRVAEEWPAVLDFSMDKNTWEKVLVPSFAVATIALVYFVNAPGILTAQGIINAYRAPSVTERMAELNKAYERDSFAGQEVVEQMTQIGIQMINAKEVSEAEKVRIKKDVEVALNQLIEDKPGDARLHVLAGNYYRSIDNLEKAMEHLLIAESLSPTKQSIIEEQGVVYLLAGKKEETMERFRTAYQLDTRNEVVLVRLATAALHFGDEETFESLVNLDTLEPDSPFWTALVTDQLIVSVAYQKKRYDLLEYIFKAKTSLNFLDVEARTNLAALYYEQGKKAEAIRVLEQAIKDIPEFKQEGESLISGLKTGA